MATTSATPQPPTPPREYPAFAPVVRACPPRAHETACWCVLRALCHQYRVARLSTCKLSRVTYARHACHLHCAHVPLALAAWRLLSPRLALVQPCEVANVDERLVGFVRDHRGVGSWHRHPSTAPTLLARCCKEIISGHVRDGLNLGSSAAFRCRNPLAGTPGGPGSLARGPGGKGSTLATDRESERRGWWWRKRQREAWHGAGAAQHYPSPTQATCERRGDRVLTRCNQARRCSVESWFASWLRQRLSCIITK